MLLGAVGFFQDIDASCDCGFYFEACHSKVALKLALRFFFSVRLFSFLCHDAPALGRFQNFCVEQFE
jgi:hypothetical protein